MTGQFVRVAETGRPKIGFTLDGMPLTALAGDTVLTAVLMQRRAVRRSEFGDGQRAGFCLMGACQDCWIGDVDGRRFRACSTLVAEGMALVTLP
jgi:predicted molibdopterin-dependent oxidoreductase YjgC